MARALTKDILRSMRSSIGRFLAILIIVALGVGFFAGLRMTAPYLKSAADAYYDNTALCDFWVTDSVGLDDKAIEQLRKVDGVLGVMPERQADALANVGQTQYAVRVHGIDMETVRAGGQTDGTSATSDDENYLNRPILVSGSWPKDAHECVISAQAASDDGIQIGDTVKLTKSARKGSLSDTFRNTTFTIVGFVRSPYYVSENVLGATTLGDGTLDDFMLVDASAFAKGLPYTGAYVSVVGARELKSGSDAYKALIAQEKAKLSDEGAQIAADRTKRVRDQAQKKLDKAKASLQANKKRADNTFATSGEKLDDAKAQLDSAKQQLEDGQEKLDANAVKLADNKKKLADARATYEESRASYEKKRAAALKKLDDAQATLDEKKKQVDELASQLATMKDQLKQLDAALAQTSRAELEAQQAQLADGIATLDASIAQIQALIDAGQGTPALEAQLASLKAQREDLANKKAQVDAALASYSEWEKQRAELDAAIKQMEPQVTAAQDQIKQAQDELTDKRTSTLALLDAAKKRLDSAGKTLKDNEAKLAQGETELNSAREKLNSGRSSYESGLSSYEEHRATYQTEKQKAQTKLANAEDRLAKAQKKIDDMKEAEWYTLDRTKIAGVETFSNDIGHVDRIATVFPLIFFLVAALVALTTITRMVEEDRVLIGTYKALGYSNRTIMSKYVWYALLASGIGAALGIAVLANFLPIFVFSAYSVLYKVPAVSVSLDPGIVALSAGLGIGLTLLAVAVTSVREKPAELMLPRAPKPGKRILLERIKPLWTRIGFSWKVTLRNIFRYKQRFFMAIIGIAGCTALMLTGFGLHDSINDIIDKQYGEGGVLSYNLTVRLDDNASAAQDQQVRTLLDDKDRVSDYLPVSDQNMCVSACPPPGQSRAAGDVNTKRIEMIVPKSTADFSNYTELRTRVGHTPVTLDDEGAVISEKLAEELGVAIGDDLLIFDQGSTGDAEGTGRTVAIAAITEDYTIEHVYLTPGCYRQVMGSDPDFNTYLCKVPGDGPQLTVLANDLRDRDGVSTVHDSSSTVEFYRTSLSSVNAVVVLLTACAALLAFAVIYNLTNINIEERVREIATLKVLGFNVREENAYIFREVIILSILGALVGLVLGIGMEQFVVLAAESDQVMFGRDIHLSSFAFSFALTLVFTVVIMFGMRGKLGKISMVNSLKSVD